MNVAQLMIKCLEVEGVKYIFGVPGEENEDFLFALEDSTISFVPVRHEQGGAFMADVWGRLTGKAGVCLATLGPGATNLMTAVADAQLDKAPLVAITGQGSSERLHHESHQVIDIIKMMEPITKWNGSINSGEVVSEMVHKAFKMAQMEKPGATHLELPENIAALEVSDQEEPIINNKIYRAVPDQQAIAKVIPILKSAKRPLILAGNGAIRTRASKAITSLSTQRNIPVASTFMAKGALSDNLDQSLGAVGLGFEDYVIEAFYKADVVLCIGYDVAEYAPSSWNKKKGKKIIHIDFDPAEVYKSYVPEVEVIGDLASAIETIDKALNNAVYPSWYDDIRHRILQSITSFTSENHVSTFNAPNVISSVREVLPSNSLLISDVGSHKMWIARNYPTHIPNGCIISNGLASMGIALPGLIAADLVDKDRPVVAIMGDGGAMMNIQELETAVRLGIKGVYIILNDNNYGLIEWKQEMNEGKSFGTKLGNPNFKALAESFNIEAHIPSDIKNLKELLKDALTHKKLMVLEIPIETKVNDQLINTLSEYFKNNKDV